MVKKLNILIILQSIILTALLVLITTKETNPVISHEKDSISTYSNEELYRLIRESNFKRNYTISGYIDISYNSDINVYGMVKDNLLAFYNKKSYHSRGLTILDNNMSDDEINIYGPAREVMIYSSIKPVVDSNKELIFSNHVSNRYNYRLLDIDSYLDTFLNEEYSITEKPGTFTITNYHKCKEVIGYFNNIILTTYPNFGCRSFAEADQFDMFSLRQTDSRIIKKEDMGINSRIAFKNFETLIKYVEVRSTFDSERKQLISIELDLPFLSFEKNRFVNVKGNEDKIIIKFYENETDNILKDMNVPEFDKVYSEDNIINFIISSILENETIEIDDGIDTSVLQTILEKNITNKNHKIEFFQKSKYKNSFISFSSEKGQVFNTDVINQMKCVAEFSKGDYMFDCLYEEKYKRYSNDEFLNESQEEKSFSFIEVDSKQYEKVDSKYTRTHFYRYEDEIGTMSLALHFSYIDELYMKEDNDYYILDILPSYLPTSNLIFNAHYFNSYNEDINYPPLYRVFVNKDTLLTEKIVYLYNGNDMADGGGDSFVFFDEYSVEMRFYDYGEARSDITNLIEQ